MQQTAHPQLDTWFADNLARGCTPQQLRQSLLDAGYMPDFVAAYLAERERQQAQQPAALTGANTTDGAAAIAANTPLAAHTGIDPAPALAAWWARCDALGRSNRVDLGDRSAELVGRHPGQGIFYLTGVLSDDECDTLVRDSAARIEGSTVVDPQTGRFVPDARRTSSGTYFARGATPVVQALEQRLAVLSGLPEPNGEGLQILYYQVGGEYRPHFDYFDPATPGCAAQLERGGQRLLTIILYLNAVDSGGGTIFPELGLEFLPQKGAALMFASLDRQGQLQKRSLHGGSPVTAGCKWIATRWIRVGAYV